MHTMSIVHYNNYERTAYDIWRNMWDKYGIKKNLFKISEYI